MDKIKEFQKEIISRLKKYSLRKRANSDKNFSYEKYMGTKSFCYIVPTPEKRKIAKEWIRMNSKISEKDFFNLITRLYAGKSHEEKSVASHLLEYGKKLRQNVKPGMLDAWLDHLHGWGEVDGLCQSIFGAKEFISDWGNWERQIKKFSLAGNIHKRRASLVLLARPVSQSGDERIATLAFEIIGRLRNEKDVLITKAVSWLLRSLIKNHQDEVREYIANNSEELPKIAVREVRNKLETGKKNRIVSRQTLS